MAVTGHITNREYIQAEEVQMTHTVLQLARTVDLSDSYYEMMYEDLINRGLGIELHGVTSISRALTKAGDPELGFQYRHPYLQVGMHYGRYTSLSERHNVRIDNATIPHDITYKLIYADTGQELAATHAALIGRLTIILQYKGTVIGIN